MANTKPKTADPITSQEIHAMIEQLETYLQTLRKVEIEAEKQPDRKLYTYGKASGRAGIDRLRTLIQNLEISRYRSTLGDPVQPGAKHSSGDSN